MEMRWSARTLLYGMAVWSCVPFLAPALGDTPELAAVGGTGILGGTVGVVIRLSNDAARVAVAGDLDIRFPHDVVEFHTPVSRSCRIAERLAATHQVGGRVRAPGLLTLAIFARDLSILPLGDGELATCDFHVLPNGNARSAALTIEFAALVDARGEDIPVVATSGAIVIADVTPEPTATVPPADCIGDCNGDTRVTIDELIRATRIALGELAVTACSALDGNGDGAVSIPEIIAAVNSSLNVCQSASRSVGTPCASK